MDIEIRKKELTPMENHVLFEGGTEAPFSGELLNEHRDGMFRCKVCNTPLFASGAKFDSGTGWPSFDQSLPGAVEYVEELGSEDAVSQQASARSPQFGMARTEVRCSTCHAHLGHVFPDGPTGTGKRYCMNSVCLAFDEKTTKDEEVKENQ
jgi:peptide-methionine (R)-S-oxide reductase